MKMKPMGITATILSITDEAQGVKTFEIEKPEGFDFLPGQYCWVSLPEFKPSPMALASGNNDFTNGTRKINSGYLSTTRPEKLAAR